MSQNFSWSIFHARLHNLLRHTPLLPSHSSILIAVSGGQDSLCLLKLLSDLQLKWHWHLAIAHCDHNWSTDQGIAAHVEKIAKNFQIPFYLKVNHSPGKESEAVARKWRYQALKDIAIEYNFSLVVTGHTATDRSETLLYNLLRGAGSDGLVSLNWQRKLEENISLIRPLLNFTREETGKFCQEFQLNVWEDQANEKLRYARNRLRLEVFPYLKEHFHPQIEQNLAQTAEIFTAEVLFLEDLTEQILTEARHSPKELHRLPLQKQPLALQRRVIRSFLRSQLPKMPNFEQIEEVRALIFAPQRSVSSSLPGGAIAMVEKDLIVLKDKTE